MEFGMCHPALPMLPCSALRGPRCALLGYLIFNVMMVNAARMMVTIQKRTVIFDS